MNAAEWAAFLKQWSTTVLNSSLATRRAYALSPDMAAKGWLGYQGASEEQIVAAEVRLATVLPPS